MRSKRQDLEGTNGMTTKQKSRRRFEQLNRLTDAVFPSMPKGTVSHKLVLMVAFRNARPNGIFVMTKARMAKITGLSPRRIRDIMKQLESWKLLARHKEYDKGLICAYRITFAIHPAEG